MEEIKLAISVKEARKLMGSSCVGLSDDQVIEIIEQLQLITHQKLRYNGSKKT